MTLLEDEPPAGVMPRLGIDCLRLAGQALLPRDMGQEEDGGGDELPLRRLPAIRVWCSSSNDFFLCKEVCGRGWEREYCVAAFSGYC